VKSSSDGDGEGEGVEVAAAAADSAGASEAGPQRSLGVEALTRELRETQAELRRLRAFLSHGLRQPMAALTIWAELLNAKQSAALDEQGRRYLRELTASVHRIAAMLASEMQATPAEPRPSDEPPPAAHPAKREDG
jgi:light-regulated signal transduction histidine kinase (bacteriophytochrome)